jgi:dCTP deaminase
MSLDKNFSTLSDKAILRHYESGEIIIEPFRLENLNTSSYDITLGEWYYREQILKDEWISNIYNIYSQEMVHRIWGKCQQALPYKYYLDCGIKLENIDVNEKIIFIKPGETILCHTNEFIGGVSKVTTMMKARSSLGRNFIETCKCAGFGDIGYFNRWTMEITNNSKQYKIPLVVGRRIAQIVFFETEGILKNNYQKNGKYQKDTHVSEVVKKWNPEDMLPKMYNDFEISKINKN